MFVTNPCGESTPRLGGGLPANHDQEITMSVPKEEIQLFVKRVESMDHAAVQHTLDEARRLLALCTPGSRTVDTYAAIIDYLERTLNDARFASDT
jgi:hypothetical protein